MSQFLLPDLGEGLEEAQLVQWLVSEGDTVQLNQPICQVETAKALVDIPSPYSGVVQRLHARPGDTVPVGAPLVTIADSTPVATSGGRPQGKDEEPHGPVLVGYGTEGPAQTFTRRRRMGGMSQRGADGGETGGGGTGATSSEVAAGLQPASLQTPTSSSTIASSHVAAPLSPQGAARGAASDHWEAERAESAAVGSGVRSASPLVRKMAAERGIDLNTVHGTGPGGRIRVEDLDAAFAHPVGASGGRPPAAPAPDEERISTVGLRKAIAARMVRAATTIPHFTEYSQFDASALVALRERLRSSPTYTGSRLTFLPFFVRAVVRAVQAYPILNSRWDEEGNAIILKRSIHVGIATDTPRGLLVPVVHNAHQLTLAQIAAECERLVALARDGKLDAKSLSGSTITITNVGAAGPVDTGAPLINPPEACVVGFGAIKPRPTVVGDALAVRPGCWISISCDHRIVDGAAAAQFMGVLVDALEHPASLNE